MSRKRLIARLDIKGENLIKGVRMEGLRKLGSPADYAMNYYDQGIDEIIYIDAVASLYGRNSLTKLVEQTAQNVFIPITVGGGIRTVEDVRKLLHSGADKIAVNTAAVSNPQLISDIATDFGSQCVVLSVQAKQVDTGRWEVYTDYGRERTGIDALEWVQRGVELGAGEILLTAVDKEGMRKGFDVELNRQVAQCVPVPVIASGGMGCAQHAIDVLEPGIADAVAMADLLHFKRSSVASIRSTLQANNVDLRNHAS